MRFLLLIILSLNSACGIDSLPISPSENTSQDTFNALLPLGKQTTTVKKEKTPTEKQYTPLGALDRIGYEYSANFGLENDELDDMFIRLTPPSGQPRRRRGIIALQE